jgi:hypothetical protein
MFSVFIFFEKLKENSVMCERSMDKEVNLEILKNYLKKVCQEEINEIQ